MLMYAHRGLSGRYPENTLLAVRGAIAAGVDGIEFDVHVTADGLPVVIHDRDVSRTTSGSGNVDEMPIASIRTLDAGAGERVPTLEEVLGLVAGAVHLDIELKGQGAESAVLETLGKFPETRWAISSFDWDILRRLRQLDPRAELWPLAIQVDEGLFAIAAALGSPAVSLLSSAYSTESAPQLREATLNVVAWTVNDAAEAARVQTLGAYAICTDDPDRVLEGVIGV